MSDNAAARAIAFYLPQFHPTTENNRWWGPGFTEWTNTARARPLFPRHCQPDLPADLGFYDLRLDASRQAQADLATEHGVTAFCYWHYWFGRGRRMLEMPFERVLASGVPGLSFCLAWANQTWSGVWHGAPDEVLVEQTYPGVEDEEAHFASLLAAFRDDRYLRVGDRPVFYVFRPEHLPNASDFVDRWQGMARRAGLEGLYLVAEISDLFGRGPAYDRMDRDGFDAGVYMRLPVNIDPVTRLRARLCRKFLRWPEIYRYAQEPVAFPLSAPGRIYQPAIFPNWDNTPRTGRRGLVLQGAHPEKFRRHVRAAVQHVADRPADERLVWVKSWNEWAEGNHLEPDLRHGRAWLRVLHEELIDGD